MRKKALIKLSSDKQQEQEQVFLLRFSDALRAIDSPDDILKHALQLLFAHLKLDCCYIGIFHLEEDYGEFLHQVRTDNFPPLPKGVRLSDFPEALLKSFTSTLVVDDILNDKSFSDIDKQSFTALGYRGLAVTTIRKGENVPLWSIVAVSSQPRHWTPGEIRLLEEATERTWATAEKAKAEEALRKSEAKYRNLFENIFEMFQLLEPIYNADGQVVDFRYLEVNKATEIVSGKKRSEMEGHTVLEIFGIVEDYWFQMLDRIMKTGQPEHIIEYSSATNMYYDVRGWKVNERTIAIIFSDITDRKRAEDDLKESQETFFKSFHANPVPQTISTLPDGLWVEVNDAFLRLFEFARDEVIGHNNAELGIIDASERARAIDMVNTQGSVNGIEMNAVTKTGKKVVVISSYESIVLKGKAHAISTLIDISYLKSIENQLKTNNQILEQRINERTEDLLKLNDALQKSNKELENFAYVASHDLQEPLRMVASFTQLLEKQYGDKLDANAKEYIGFAVVGAKRMYELINGLLAYSRITRKEELFTIVDLNKVIEEVKDNLEVVISERNCHIESEELPVVSADKTQMLQLFQNLVSNGIKFSPGIPHITISARKEDSEYIFSVKDGGIGIEPKYFDRIFQIFQRLHHRDQFDGTGIGLAICKKIVENHKGRIWVESESGCGSVFYFTIPI